MPRRVTRLTITTAGSALTINGTDRDLALSPDGTHVVYSSNNGTQLLPFATTPFFSRALGGTTESVPFGMNLLGDGGTYTVDPGGANQTVIKPLSNSIGASTGALALPPGAIMRRQASRAASGAL